MKQGKGKQGPATQGTPSQTAESLWEQIEQERTALADERERFEAERAAWQASAAELQADNAPDLDARLTGQQARLDTQRRELEEARASLTARQAELDAVQLDLDQREAALEQLRRDIARDNESLTKAREEVQRLSGSLESDQASLQVDRLTEFYQQQQTEIDAERQELQSLHERIRQERAEWADELQQLQDGQAGIERRAAALDERAQQLETERKALEQQRKQFTVERSELGEDQTKLESMQAELARQRTQLEQELLEVRGQRDRITNQQAHLDEQRASLEAEQAALADRSESVERQRIALTGQREKLVARQEELEAEHAECQNLRQQLQQEAEQHRAELRQKVEQFETQLTQVTERGRQLATRQRELDDREQALQETARQAEEQEAQRRAEAQAEQKDLDQHRQQIETEEARLTAERQDLDRRAAELDEHIAGFSADRERILGIQSQFEARQAELESKSADLQSEADQLQADRRQFEQERQDAAREATQERQLLEQQREALAHQEADVTEREAQLASEVAALQQVAPKDQADGPVRHVVIESGGFNLQRALVASTVLAAVGAIAVAFWVGFRHEVRGIIAIETTATPEQALRQHAAMLNTPLVIEAAAKNANADVSPADISNMIGHAGEIEVKVVPEQKEIHLVAQTRNSARSEAVIQALGDALVSRIESRATSTGPTQEHQRLQTALTEAKTQLQQDETRLARAEQAVRGLSQPDPPVDQLGQQFLAAQARWEQAEQAWRAADMALSAPASSPASVAVDSDRLRKAIQSDPQHRQDSEACRLRAQQLHGLLTEGLAAAEAPLASLSEKVAAFDQSVAERVKDKPADSVPTELRQIRTALAACRKTTADSAKTWNQLLKKLRQQDVAKTAQSVLADQKQAEKLLADFVDQLRAPIMEIHKQVQAIAQTGGEDMTRRIVIQDTLRKQTEELTSALREFANAGAEVIPMSNQRLDACVRQVRQLQARLNEREKAISAGMAERIRDQAAEAQEKRMAALRQQAAAKTEARDQALADLLRLVGQLAQGQKQQNDFENARGAVEVATDCVERSKARVADAEAQIAAFRNQAGALPASDRRDRARFSGAIRKPGLANQSELVRSAGGVAVFVFAVSWLVSWLVSGGRAPAPTGGRPARTPRR